MAQEERSVREEGQEAVVGLAAAVAHAVRNPTMVIGGLLRHVQRQQPDCASLEPWMPRLLHEVHRLEELVERLQDIANEPPPSLTPSDLRSIVNSSLERHESLAGVLCKEMVVVVEEELPRVLLDPSLMSKALDELIINAMRATPGGGKVDISVRSQGNGKVIISISDSGPGITDGLHEGTLAPLKARDPGHIGLGFTRATKIVEDHQGNIQVSSAPGQGTRVDIILPSCDGTR